MKKHSLRVCLAQIEVLPGKPVENTKKIISSMQTARQQGAELIVFPEMAVPGYLLGDEWERPAFLRECEDCGNSIRENCGKLVTVFGNVAIDHSRKNEDGRVRKYNAAFIAYDGQFLGPENSPCAFVSKTLMPNYREFDDSRHFFDLRKLAQENGLAPTQMISPVKTPLGLIGCMLCEDAWHGDYNLSPAGVLCEQGAAILINLSASPFTAHKNNKRNRVFSELARHTQRPLIYINKTGIQDNGKTVYTFDGVSCVYSSSGTVSAQLPAFTEQVTTFTVPLHNGAPSGIDTPAEIDESAELYEAIEYGTAKFLQRCGIERVVIGVSGGIDSALTAALYRRCLPPENILLVNMPSRYNSAQTKDLAFSLAENLGCLYTEISIEDSVALTVNKLDGLKIASVDGRLHHTINVSEAAKENIQARDRSSRFLAALAAAFGGAFTCNSNKTELTVGYTTLYGDLGGFLACIADLWKTEVYAVAQHLNSNIYDNRPIPQGSFDIIPSAELGPGQDITRGLGDPLIYPYHDTLFSSWVERWNRASPEDILEWFAAGKLEQELNYAGNVSQLFAGNSAFIADLERWWNLYQGIGIAKRIQAPPVLAVKRRAFGFDHREAQIGARYTARYFKLKKMLTA